MMTTENLTNLCIKKLVEDTNYYGTLEQLKNQDDLHDTLLNICIGDKRIEDDPNLYQEMTQLLHEIDIGEINDAIIEECCSGDNTEFLDNNFYGV